MTPVHRFLSRHGISIAIAAAGIAVATSLSWYEFERLRTSALKEFEGLIDEHTSRMQELYDLNLATQQAVNSFFHASQAVTQDEFTKFLAHGSARQAPYVAMQYAPRIRAEHRARFEADLRKAFNARAGIWERDENDKPRPAQERDAYFPVQFTYPNAMSPIRGFDVGSESVRLSALMLAAKTGKPAITEPIRLIQHPDHWGFLIFAPLRDSLKPCEDEIACVASVTGYSVGAYRFQGVPLSVIQSARSTRYDLFIYASDSLDARPVFKHYSEAPTANSALEPTVNDLLKAPVQWRNVRVAQKSLRLGFVNKSPLPLLWYGPGAMALLILGLLLTTVVVLARERSAKDMRQLRERERQWATLISNLPGLVYRCRNDPAWTMEFVTDGITTLTGYPTSDFLSQVRTFADMIVEDDRGRVWNAVQRALVSKRPFQIEYRIKDTSGAVKWVWEHGCGVYSQGELRALEGFITDVTERHRAQELLAQTEKLDAIGKLTGGMAHDFNNLLSIIIGSLDLALMKADDLKLKSHVNTALDAALRGAGVIKSLLAIARRQPLDEHEVDLKEMLIGMLPLIRQTVGPPIEVRTSFEENNLFARIDGSAFNSAVLNLVVNARDAMQRGGLLTVSASSTSIHSADAAEAAVLEPGRYAIVEVTDNGAGMPAGVAARAFEPFFTTKGAQKGTGLGLSTVYGFARQSGGTVDLHSDLGKGTAVRIYLPMVGPVSEHAELSIKPRNTSSRGEKVLLVDDELALVSVAKEWLEALSYRVSTAPNAIEALRMLKEDSWDVLFSDIVMPGGMDGIELAQKATALRPQLRVLLASGFSEQMIRSDGMVWELLRKPYRQDELAAALRRVLDKST